jgi:dolichyl-diphosphooligosaccharide--protein glycosyltransferase
MPSKKSAKAATSATGERVSNGLGSAPIPGPAPTAASGPQSDPTAHLLVDDVLAEKNLPNGHVTPSASDRSESVKRSGLAYPLPKGISAETINNTESLLRFVILALISGAAIASRLFAVIRFESVIHEL